MAKTQDLKKFGLEQPNKGSSSLVTLLADVGSATLAIVVPRVVQLDNGKVTRLLELDLAVDPLDVSRNKCVDRGAGEDSAAVHALQPCQ